jgi:formate hydrogenlyase subunit 3/multisubunit Na+/H+ antiporter MnhD subunit
MPFLLLAGSELAILAGLPIDPLRAQPITILLSVGFGLLLAFPPFHFWLPDAADESPPYSVALILSLYFGAVLFFLLRFLDTYAWRMSIPSCKWPAPFFALSAGYSPSRKSGLEEWLAIFP